MCRSEHGGVRHCCGGVHLGPCGVGALWRSLKSGLFVDHALASASHHVQGVLAGGIADVFLY